ncbi:MAG: class III extradiol ring-cleavage dioxygenase, partial [Myxococcota bacterium]
PLFFDYYGFPDEAYRLTWPAPGAPSLAARVRSLLESAGLPSAESTDRGFDHGTFVPLKVAWPGAEVPCTQLSLVQGLDPALHLQIGRALAPLRDEGVLIVGSGMSYHNMRGFGQPSAVATSEQFHAWLHQVVARGPTERDQGLARWAEGPSARACHPREEHLLPLMVAAGAGGADLGRVTYTDRLLGVQVSAVQFG